MIDNSFRAYLPRFVGPLLGLYSRLGVTPNLISITSLALAVVAAYCCAQDWPMAAIGIWWLGRLLDGTDGIYARATGQATSFGAYLDIVCDMAAYSCMIIGFAILHPSLSSVWLGILFLYVLCIASALALGSLTQSLAHPPADNRGLRLGAGLAEGGETGIAYTCFLLWPSAIGWLAPVWVAVLGVTVMARTMLARRILTPRVHNKQRLQGS